MEYACVVTQGNVVSIGAFRDHVKVNFFKGASLDDPHALFNAGLEAKASRAIDVRQGGVIDENAFRDLVRVMFNQRKPKPKRRSSVA